MKNLESTRRPPVGGLEPRTTVALGLGANLGRPKQALRAALRELGGTLSDMRVSPLFRSEPISDIPQPDFYNLAVVGQTNLAAEDLLEFLQSLESAAGRTRGGPQNGPRQLDIDILLYGDRVSEDPHLTLPHPRMRSRRFVLEPLEAIAPNFKIPPSHGTISRLLAQLPRDREVQQISWRDR